MSRFQLRILETADEMAQVEDVQRRVWPGDDADIVPAHLLIAAVRSGGLVIAAFPNRAASAKIGYASPGDDLLNKTSTGEIIPDQADGEMVAFVFGFPGLYFTPDGPRTKHASHMLAVLPEYRDQGIGFLLKRAQWQMVRNQGLDRVTWTYDPLQSRNAYLNIARLGAVCNTYIRDAYGEMRDELNAGVTSDRFQVDWWVNSQRVNRRLSKRARPQLGPAHYIAAGTVILNPSHFGADGLARPGAASKTDYLTSNLLMVEIPADFASLRLADPASAIAWRMQTRAMFEQLFAAGYLTTDFVHLPGEFPRSFYVLSHGESTL